MNLGRRNLVDGDSLSVPHIVDRDLSFLLFLSRGLSAARGHRLRRSIPTPIAFHKYRIRVLVASRRIVQAGDLELARPALLDSDVYRIRGDHPNRLDRSTLDFVDQRACFQQL